MRRITSVSSAPSKGKISIVKMFLLSWISKLRQGTGNDNGSSGKRIGGMNAKNVKRNVVGLQEEKSCKDIQGRKGDASKVAKKESKDFNKMLLDIKKTRESSPHIEAKGEANGKEVREPTKSISTRRDGKFRNLDLHQLSSDPSRYMKYAGLKDTSQKTVCEKGRKGDQNIQNVALKDITEVETVKPIKISPISPSSLSSEKHHHEAPRSLGAGEERKSIYIRRSKSGRRSKVKFYSPRTPSKAELCKIRALEDLKKTRMKTRVRKKEEQGKKALESLAVVKQSVDPQRDFRNSMLEMILDKGISQPEELEGLLSCYLILNSDEYHELIIKIFRQVWFDLNQDCLDLCQRNAEV